MENKPDPNIDPREETPHGFYLKGTPSPAPESLFSIKDAVVMFLLIGTTIVVAIVLWLHPPRYITFENRLKPDAIAATPKQKIPKNFGYDTSRFEEAEDPKPEDEPAAAPIEKAGLLEEGQPSKDAAPSGAVAASQETATDLPAANSNSDHSQGEQQPSNDGETEDNHPFQVPRARSSSSL